MQVVTGQFLAQVRHMRTFWIAIALTIAATSSATGQTPPSPAAQTAAPPTIWRIGVGYQSLYFRDVSRAGAPVDASPVTWTARGPAVEVQYDRSARPRLHRLQFRALWAGDAALLTATRNIAQDSENSAEFGGAYEYRRYPFRDLGMRGLDVGVGVEGGAVVRTLRQRFDSGIETRDRGADFTVAVVAAGRLERWRAVQLEALWTNGMAIGHSTFTHSTAAQTQISNWGGGWLTDLSLRADIRLAGALTTFVSYFTTGRGFYQSHANSVTGRQQFTAGVTYGR